MILILGSLFLWSCSVGTLCVDGDHCSVTAAGRRRIHWMDLPVARTVHRRQMVSNDCAASTTVQRRVGVVRGGSGVVPRRRAPSGLRTGQWLGVCADRWGGHPHLAGPLRSAMLRACGAVAGPAPISRPTSTTPPTPQHRSSWPHSTTSTASCIGRVRLRRPHDRHRRRRQADPALRHAPSRTPGPARRTLTGPKWLRPPDEVGITRTNLVRIGRRRFTVRARRH